MSRRGWINLGLALALAALAALAVLRPGLAPPPAPPALTTLDARDTRRIELERPKQETIVLERAGENWRLRQPLSARASRFRIENLLRIATAASEWRAPASPEELARYGLARPQVIVRLDGEELRFGALHPLKPQQYVLVGDTVHLVAASHFHSAATRLEDFLDSAPLEAGAELAAIALPDLALERTTKGWRLTPENREVASDRIQRLVEEWKHARALSVARTSNRPATGRVRLRLAPGVNAPARTLDLAILAREPELVLRRADEGLEYHFPAEAAARLLRLPPEPSPEPTGADPGKNKKTD